jgi:hypothetical protein
MSTSMLFLIAALTLALYLWWGFRFLPGERWQIIATIPAIKSERGDWLGINFTWYGLLTANAYLVAVMVLLILLGSIGVPPYATAFLTAAMLGCCVPASRFVARIVEKKAHTFTVGGAVFVGIIVTPLIIVLLNRAIGPHLGFHIPLVAAYAAIAIAYAFGEGLGRLACISFGCCYGKPVPSDNGLLSRLFTGRGFSFFGHTKKAVYADGLEAVELIPVQALTAMLYTVCALSAAALFLASHHTAAFLLAAGITQGWRSFSETLRADYRGEGTVSAYQIMGIVGMLYAVVMVKLSGVEQSTPAELANGISSLWHPALILFLQAIWIIIFLYTGRSTVTGATINFHVHTDRV